MPFDAMPLIYYFIGAYMVDRILHSQSWRYEDSLLVLKNISLVLLAHLRNILSSMC